MIGLLKWAERLSMDAVVVAVFWGCALARAGGLTMAPGSLLVLALATWLTYVADRLIDTCPGKTIPDTPRHLYYKSNYARFRTAWWIVFPLTVALAFLALPLWTVFYGWGLVGAIAAYLYTAGKIGDRSRRIVFKRIAVPLVFTGGVGLMAESWRTPESGAATGILLLAALGNVILISLSENQGLIRQGLIEKAAYGGLLALLLGANAVLLLYWPAGLAGLLCGGLYFIGMIRIKTRPGANARAWMDLSMVLSGVMLWLLAGWGTA